MEIYTVYIYTYNNSDNMNQILCSFYKLDNAIEFVSKYEYELDIIEQEQDNYKHPENYCCIIPQNIISETIVNTKLNKLINDFNLDKYISCASLIITKNLLY